MTLEFSRGTLWESYENVSPSSQKSIHRHLQNYTFAVGGGGRGEPLELGISGGEPTSTTKSVTRDIHHCDLNKNL